MTRVTLSLSTITPRKEPKNWIWRRMKDICCWMIQNIGGAFKTVEDTRVTCRVTTLKGRNRRYLTGFEHCTCFSVYWRTVSFQPSFSFSIKKKVKKGSGSSGSKTLPTGNSPSRRVESPAVSRRLPVDPSEAIGTAIVKYNYQAQQLDEISLTKGTRILILEKSNDGFVSSQRWYWFYRTRNIEIDSN